MSSQQAPGTAELRRIRADSAERESHAKSYCPNYPSEGMTSHLWPSLPSPIEAVPLARNGLDRLRDITSPISANPPTAGKQTLSTWRCLHDTRQRTTTTPAA